MMTYVESNTTTLGLGISLDSDPSSISSSQDNTSGIFSDIELSSSVSDALDDSSDVDNYIVYSDDELNVYYVDRRDILVQQMSPDFPTWSPLAGPLQPVSRSDPVNPEVMDGYESDADDQLDELLWRRTRAKRRRAHRSRVHCVAEQHEPVFEMVTPAAPAERPAHDAPIVSTTSTTAAESGNPANTAPTTNPVQDDQHLDKRAPDVDLEEEPQEFPHETEFSRLMGQMDMPSESDSDYEEFYGSDEEHPQPKRVHYTSARLEPTFVDLPVFTEEQVDVIRRGYALGIPMEDFMPFFRSTTFNEPDGVAKVALALDQACSSVRARSSASSSDSMESIDLNSDGDEGRAAHTVNGRAVLETPADSSTSAAVPPEVQLGPFCVFEGPLQPVAGMLCASPITEKRRRSLEKAGLLPTQ